MGVKKCELCNSPARIHCESDQANLCWDCDAEVHGANFLVARHSRCLLCRRCQSLTPWRAEGSRLGGTVSVCQLCAATASGSLEGSGEGARLCIEEEKREEEGGRVDRDEEKEDGEREEVEEEEEEEEGEESENGEEEDDIDEGENQVVPWSLTPPPGASSSSSDYEEEETDRTAGNTGVFLKRMRENDGLTVSQLSSKRKLVPVSDSRNVLIQSQDDPACSSSCLASDPAASAVAPDEINSLTPPFRSFRDRKRPAHALPSLAPPAADATTASMLNFRVHNANHRQGVGVFHAPKSA